MPELNVEQAIDNIYAAIKDNNRDLDAHIVALRSALAAGGMKAAVFEPKQLAQSNRQGRKMMQAYFRQRGVTVSFASK